MNNDTVKLKLGETKNITLKSGKKVMISITKLSINKPAKPSNCYE